jgi:hypothetical protein
MFVRRVLIFVNFVLVEPMLELIVASGVGSL